MVQIDNKTNKTPVLIQQIINGLEKIAGLHDAFPALTQRVSTTNEYSWNLFSSVATNWVVNNKFDFLTLPSLGKFVIQGPFQTFYF